MRRLLPPTDLLVIQSAAMHPHYLLVRVVSAQVSHIETLQARVQALEQQVCELTQRLEDHSEVHVHLEHEMERIRQAVPISASSSEEASRFSAIPSNYKLSYGTHEEYDKGLSALVGAPVANASQLEKAIADEHRRDPIFGLWSNQFKVMYNVEPALEYEYCQCAAQAGGHAQYRKAIFPNRDLKRDAGQDGMLVEGFTQNYVEALLNLMAVVHDENLTNCAQNCGNGIFSALEAAWAEIQSAKRSLAMNVGSSELYEHCYRDAKEHIVQYNDLVRHAKIQELQLLVVNELQRLEVVCIRLYSGPMFKRYNETARWQKKGVYATTIALTSSAQIKLSKICKACRVYRGICGGQLPGSFYRPNVFGSKGGIERAFMSTTTHLSVAAEFAASEGQGKIGVVYEMEMGMIDRGADLSIMSQYPHEKEILFAPLTGLEVQGTVRKGDVLHISARLNTNMKAQTIEELQGKMKNSHLNLIRIVEEDLEGQGIDTREGSIDQHRRAAGAASELQFNSTEFYVRQTQQALDCQQETCKLFLLQDGVAATSDQFLAVARLLTSSVHFLGALCALSEEKAAMLAQNTSIQEVAFKDLPRIDADIVSKLGDVFGGFESSSVTLDLTGEIMTDSGKVMTGEMLLDVSDRRKFNDFDSVRTDLYTISKGQTGLDLADKNLRTPDAALLVGCVFLFCKSLRVLDISCNKEMGVEGCQCIVKLLERLSFGGFGRGHSGGVRQLTFGDNAVTVDTGMVDADFSGKGLASCGGAILGASLPRCTMLTQLDVSNNNLATGGSWDVAKAVPALSALSKFTFSGGTDPVGCKAWQEGHTVTMEAGMPTMDFSNKNLGPSGAMLVSAFLPKCRSLRSLDLSFNELASESSFVNKSQCAGQSFNAGDMVMFQGANCPVTRAADRDGDLKLMLMGGISALATAIQENHTLTHFAFSGSKYWDDETGEEVQAPVVVMLASMAEADYSDKHLGAAGAILLSAFLPNCERLSVLDISKNQIGTDQYGNVTSAGSKAAAQALECQVCPLTKLTFSGGVADGYGGWDEGITTTMHDSMTEADFSNKQLGDAGAIIVVAFLPVCSALSALFLSDNDITSDVKAGLKERCNARAIKLEL